MKFSVRCLCFLLPLFVITIARAGAQDAAEIAARREVEERNKQLNSDIQSILAAQQSLQSRLSRLEQLEDRIRASEIKHARESAGYATKEDLRRVETSIAELAKSLQKVEANRDSDKKLMLDAVEALRKENADLRKLIKDVVAEMSKTPIAIPAPPPRDRESEKPRDTETTEPAAAGYTGPAFEYTVKSGDTISAICEAYNLKLKEEGSSARVTTAMILKANPKLKPERMSVGTVIVIPDPRH